MERRSLFAASTKNHCSRRSESCEVGKGPVICLQSPQSTGDFRLTHSSTIANFGCVPKNALVFTASTEALSTWPNMYGPPSDCKEKAEGEKTSLRKCIRQ